MICLPLLQGTKDFMSGMGLGMIMEQLSELKLGELLDTPPPGLDEAVAIAKVTVLQCCLHGIILLRTACKGTRQ